MATQPRLAAFGKGKGLKKMDLTKVFASRTRLRLVLALLCMALGTAALWAQADTGTISGQITDEQGAAIPAASIHLVEANTGSSRSAQTNEQGRFTLVSLPVGTYSFTVSKDGFQTSKATGQKVDIGEVLTLNISLKIGTATLYRKLKEYGAKAEG